MGAAPSYRLRLLLLSALHVAALALFVRGFLLTRVHLPQRAQAAPNSAGGAQRPPAPYDKLVLLMIDALRYDMVVADGRYACLPGRVCHQRRMANLTRLLEQHPTAARAFNFVADAPTTTTQRLKSLASGGLPTFFDIGSSFNTGAMADDNLLLQLKTAGKKLVFMGDTTWVDMFPDAWDAAHPFPCFNVKDLHTVDDGIWEHLLPTLRNRGAWDVLVAHYLGVDHCGHSHGVSSPEMVAKLEQMDDHVSAVLQELLQQAGPGQAHRRTLLLVAGDHGQTLGGDHGGGSPEEVDSGFVAVDLGALHDAMRGGNGGRSSGSGDNGGGSGSGEELQAGDGTGESNSPVSDTGSGGSDGSSSDSGHSGGSSGSGAQPSGVAPCRAGCSCGVERNQCAPDLPQLDFAASMAALLGVPIPFGNLGSVSAELWGLAAWRESEAAAAAGLAAELRANVEQVHRYLNAYAAAPGASFSPSILAGLNTIHESLSGPDIDGIQPPAAAETAYYAYLGAASEAARQEWTQFRPLPMVLGLALLAASLGLNLAFLAPAPAAWAGGGRTGPAAAARRLWQRAGQSPVTAALAGVAVAQAAGIFSFFFLLSEGVMVCCLVAITALILALAAAWRSHGGKSSRASAAALGALMLLCDSLMAAGGLAHHSGQGFWRRLTVHEEQQPGGSVVRGWQAALLRPLLDAWRGRLSGGGGELLPALAGRAATCMLPTAVLAALGWRQLRGQGFMQRLAFMASMICAAAFHLLEPFQTLLGKDISACQLAGQAGLSSQAPAIAAVLQRWAGGQAAATLCATPLRFLLPWATYALCGVGALLWLLRAVSPGVRTSPEARAAALAAGLLPAVIQVSDSKAALALLLGAAEAWAAVCLLCRAHSAASPAAPPAAGLVLAAIQSQLFFATGHLCEFAGLDYTAAFVGSDEFDLARGAVLMSLETFGGMALAALAAPWAVRRLAGVAGDDAARGTAAGAAVGETATKQQQAQGRRQGQQQGQAGAVGRALLTMQLARTLLACTATLSAAIQRRHLYVWSLFAPRFVFEAAFLLVSDLLLFLTC